MFCSVESRCREHVNTRLSGRRTWEVSGLGRLATVAEGDGTRSLSASELDPRLRRKYKFVDSQDPFGTNIAPNVWVVGEESEKQVAALVAGRKEKPPRMLSRLIP